MDEFVYLRDLVVILAIAVIAVTALHRLKVPPIAAFILAGVLVGPKGLSLINDMHQVEVLAEIGVALLLFGIGLEISLDRLKRLWRPVVFGGSIQVGFTVMLAFSISRLFEIPVRTSILIGFIVAVSSTAIVLRGLEIRGEIDAPHGRLTLGILVFQDLCVVPMMLAIPLLAGVHTTASDVALTLGKAVGIVAGVLIASRLIVPRILHMVARTRQRHLFVMAVLLICIGTAWLTSSAGVSLALGAFLAGLVVAGSEYRHQAMADLISFKDIFTSIFFVSIGMLLVPADVAANIVLILILMLVILAGKFGVVFLTGLIMRLPLRVAVLAGVALCQIGEFSFLLVRSSQKNELIDASLAGNLIAVAIITMFLTPFALSLGPHIAAGAGRIRVLTRLMKVSSADEAIENGRAFKDHVIVGGYGYAGQELAAALKDCGIPSLIVDVNTDNIRKALADGERAFFGDITSPEVLERLGAARAKEFVIVINDPAAVERAVKTARIIAPGLHIVVRTRYLLDIQPLLDAGADEVVTAEQEAAVEIVNRILNRCQIERATVTEEIKQIRKHTEDA
jgi:CPA2 family monovalent cation:H+ antiporter-2